MKIRFYNLLILLWLASITGSAQEIKPFDQLISDDAFIYISGNPSEGAPMAFPNYETAMKQWLEAMNDILEWKVLHGEFQALLDSFGLQDGLSPLIGDRWAIAAFGFGESFTRIPTVLYLSYVKDPKQADQLLTQAFQNATQLSTMLNTDQDIYRDYSVRTFYGPGRFPGVSLSYTMKGSLLLISTSKPFLLKYLEQLEIGIHPLASHPTYQTVLSRLPQGSNRLLYINLSGISDTGKLLIESLKAIMLMGGGHKKDLNNIINIAETVYPFLNSIKAFGGATKYQNEKRITSNFALFDPAIAGATFAGLWNKKPTALNFDDYLPRRTSTFAAGNILTLNDIWKTANTILAASPVQKTWNEILKSIETEFGISIEKDILSWMGDEWCLIQPVVDLDAIIPVNQGAVILRVKDSMQAIAGLSKLQLLLTERLKLPIKVETEKYQGVEITAVRFPIPILPFSPSWCIRDNLFILASNTGLLRDMLDVKSGSIGGINRNVYFKSLKPTMADPANLIFFQDVETTLYTVREAMRRASAIPEIGKELLPGNVMMPPVVMDRISYLLMCTQIWKASARRTKVDETGIASEKVLVRKDLPAVPAMEGMRRNKVSIGAKDWIEEIAKQSVEKGNKERAVRLYSALAEFYPDQDRYQSALKSLKEK